MQNQLGISRKFFFSLSGLEIDISACYENNILDDIIITENIVRNLREIFHIFNIPVKNIHHINTIGLIPTDRNHYIS